jgi:hypothetical protein
MPQGVANSAIGGAAGSEAQYVVDGLNTADFRRGFQGARLRTGSSDSSATVDVVGASFTGNETVSFAPVHHARALRYRNGASDAGPLVLGAVKADRPDVPVARVTAMIAARLKSLTRPGLLRQLPSTLNLILEVDGSGAVTRVLFDRELGHAGAEVETLVRTWRFEAWSVTGHTVLRVPLTVRR